MKPIKQLSTYFFISLKVKVGKPIGKDDVFKIFTSIFAIIILVILGLMVYKLVESSMPSIKRFGLEFLVGIKWDPSISNVFGILPLILGTLVTSAIALIIAVPISLFIGLALSEYLPKKFSFIVSFLVELLAVIPSVVYGIWGIFTLIPFMRNYVYPYLQSALGFIPLFSGLIYGGGVLTSGIILAIMIIPIISAVSRDVFSSVPITQREAMISLGATKWEVSKTVMSYARSGIIGAIILGLGRAVGETMAVTMVIGNKFHFLPSSIFDAWYTMPAIIANEFLEAEDLHLSALIEIGLVLFIITLVINMLARVLVWRYLKTTRGIVRE
ncbi:MAG: phosphate ABC transporter permease subunit PstC [Thermoproteota archaeon]